MNQDYIKLKIDLAKTKNLAEFAVDCMNHYKNHCEKLESELLTARNLAELGSDLMNDYKNRCEMYEKAIDEALNASFDVDDDDPMQVMRNILKKARGISC